MRAGASLQVRTKGTSGVVEASRTEDSFSIIALDKFIQATRDSGYKGTTSALSELVDNSIQAGATRIAITVSSYATPPHLEQDLEVSVLDNGCGMDLFTLRQALRFGGSTRFGDRSGLGRYGMGLPNASLSQARRVTVYTWRTPPASGRGVGTRGASEPIEPPPVFRSYLDVDAIAAGEMKEVPLPEPVTQPPPECAGSSGTLVVWTRCDRLDHRRVSTTAKNCGAELARRFRHYLWNGLSLTVNGEAIKPLDPLFLRTEAQFSGARLFGEELTYEVRVESDASKTGTVRVRFSELPVHDWHGLSNEDKRRLGISKGAGVSIVRAGREVDYGWFFMGAKHRENYDDWWRCEVQFEPALDEAFGITHTKQQVRPRAHLIDALTPDIEATGRALSARARKAHSDVKASEAFSEAERVASAGDLLLQPLPNRARASDEALMKSLQRNHPEFRRRLSEGKSRYAIVAASLPGTAFFSSAFDGDRIALVINPDHPFYREIYGPLAASDGQQDKEFRGKLELLLLAAARSEVASTGTRGWTPAKQRAQWSDALAAFLNSR